MTCTTPAPPLHNPCTTPAPPLCRSGQSHVESVGPNTQDWNRKIGIESDSAAQLSNLVVSRLGPPSAVPTVNLAHADLTGSEQCTKQHRGCLS
jgi:hypothetical protein